MDISLNTCLVPTEISFKGADKGFSAFSRPYTFMGQYYNSISVANTVIVWDKCLIIGQQVAIIFVG